MNNLLWPEPDGYIIGVDIDDILAISVMIIPKQTALFGWEHEILVRTADQLRLFIFFLLLGLRLRALLTDSTSSGNT